jgi:ribA/ribD-fused uncharacterized protein
MHEIRFYRSNEKPFGCFSNLYRRKVWFHDREYETSEHAYQAGKARDPMVAWWILAAPKPHLVASAAHGLLSFDIMPGWSKNRRARMREVVECKFRQHPDLAEILLSTGDARIVESSKTNNEVNRRWGEVEGVGGANWLGLILMEVRETLKNDNKSS